MVKVGAALDEATINRVCSPAIRAALLKRLNAYNGDAKKAFTGRNSIDKNPIYLDVEQTKIVPALVKTIEWGMYHPIRKRITPDLKIDKVIDKGIREKLKARLAEFNGDAQKAFSNLEENPIYLDEAKKIVEAVAPEKMADLFPDTTIIDRVKALRGALTQQEFSKAYGVPLRTLQSWEIGDRVPPAYVLDLLEFRIKHEA